MIQSDSCSENVEDSEGLELLGSRILFSATVWGAGVYIPWG